MLHSRLLATVVLLSTLLLAAFMFYEWTPTTLRVAVAPRDGTEPELLSAFAAALAERHQDLRLTITAFDDVGGSAAALDAGRADLAVVRPDVALPADGLTVAVLRDQALLIAFPGPKGPAGFGDLAGKRLGIVSHEGPDSTLLKTLLAAYGLTLRLGPRPPAAAKTDVFAVELPEQEVTTALRAKTIDGVVSVIAPTAPRAAEAIGLVAAAAPSGKVSFVSTEDGDALVERFPLLQSVTVPAALFGGRPRIPAEDVKTVGVSYRLMARRSLSRTAVASLTQHLFEMRSALARQTPASYYIAPPSYDTTVAATSARLPNHPGAIDYYERDQHGFIDRYSDTLYFLALIASGAGSLIAWVRQHLARLRKERIEEITDRLLEIADAAAHATGKASLLALSVEVEALALDAARWARDHEPSQRTTIAMSLALDVARRSLSGMQPLPITAANEDKRDPESPPLLPRVGPIATGG